MKQVFLVAVKFLAMWAVIGIMFGVFGITYQPVWLYAAILTAIAYIVGDVGILRTYGNTVAAIADILLATLTIWLSMALFNPARSTVPTVTFGEALAVGVVVGVVEMFYHMLVSAQLHFGHHRHEPVR